MATQVIAGPLPVERDSEQARKRRRAWIAWLAVILAIFLCLFTCGQLSLLGAAPDTSGMASGSAMNADYAAWQGWSFGPLLPQIALEAIRDLGMGDPFAVATSTTCLLGNTCPTATAVSPSSTPLGGPSATPTGGASPTPVAPTRTNTPVTTATNQPATSTPTITPTPTPLVYPVKLANPVNIPPGSTTVQFTIMVINYGNPTGAELTEVIDRLPAGDVVRRWVQPGWLHRQRERSPLVRQLDDRTGELPHLPLHGQCGRDLGRRRADQ